MRIAIYPGSFDPITNGHIDIIRRGLSMFDKVIVSVGVNDNKTGLFSFEERVGLIQEVFENDPRVECCSFTGLLMKHAEEKKATAILRGLRAVSDFEYEFQMATLNRKLCPQIETCFVMASQEHFYISSSVVRELSKLGGPVGDLVPPVVLKALLRATHLRKKIQDPATVKKLQ